MPLLGRDGAGGGLRGGRGVVGVMIGSWGREAGGLAGTRAVPVVFGWRGRRRWRLGARRFLEGASTGRRGRAVRWWRRRVRFRRRREQCPV